MFNIVDQNHRCVLQSMPQTLFQMENEMIIQVRHCRFILLGMLLSVSVFLFGGCAALVVGGAAGAGTVAYVGGELKAEEEASLNRAWAASQMAMKSLEFAVTSREKDAFSAQLVARGAGDKKIKIKLKSQSDKVTEIRIRVGIFGDESLSLRILDKIRSYY